MENGKGNKNRLTLDGSLFCIKEKENNLIKNGNFSMGLSYWDKSNCDNNDTYVDGKFRFIGNSDVDKNIGQTIDISGKKGDIYNLAGWVNSRAVQNDFEKVRKISISIHFVRPDNTRQIVDKNINVDGSGWQFKSEVVIADSDYSYMAVYLVCTNNANETYFDNIGLFKEEFGQSYTYDGEGNVVSTKDNTKSEQTFKYDPNNNNLISAINPMGGKFDYEYDKSNPKKLVGATNSLGNQYTFDYDSKGNMTSAKVKASNENVNVKYTSQVQDYGWLETVSNGAITGKFEEEKRLEALKIYLEGAPEGAHVEYEAHVQNYGWMNWVQDGTMAGTVGEELRMEAIRIRLVNLPNYSIKYRAYVEGIGWQNWTQDGMIAGTLWESKKICAIQIKLENDNNKYNQAQAEYSSNGNYQTKLIDETGNATQYEYDEHTGNVTKITDAKNNETNYNYDMFDRVTKVTKQANGKEYKNEYTYKNDMIETITHNRFKYTFSYDTFGNVKETKVGNQVLAINHYEPNNGNLESIAYGNNQSVAYNYDRFNRLIKTEGTNGQYEYTYDAKSNVKTIVDSANSNTQTYTYDLADRLVKESNTNGFTREYEYDINNNTNGIKYTLSNKVNRVKYNYDNVNRLNNIKLNDNITWENNYDSLSRVSSKKIVSGSKNYTTTYTYKDVENVKNKTTTQLNTIQNGNNESISYTYDAIGNIETIKKGNEVTNQYYYDELNQLVKEINILEYKMITYEYDEGGNIQNKEEYFYYGGNASSRPSETITYTYGNTNWRDQLTSYNGKAITYDEIGNIVTYDGNTYTWQNGRQLAGIRNSGSTITYKYNDNGIRTQKTINGTTTNYYVDGNKVIYEKTGSNVIYYTYNENGNIIGLNYNNTQYYYIRNGQNDVIGILDSNLNQVVSYEYDSWGNTISIKDANGNNITSSSNIGIINPYRYRSYRYDTETGLYYLNSRYYNPEWGRFINADGIIGANEDILRYNLYIYCSNNPVNGFDPTGMKFINPIISIWNTIGNALNLVFGFEYTKSIKTSQSEIINDGIIKTEVGASASVNIAKVGSSDKPISVYVNNNNKISNSSVGIKLNILRTSLTFNVGVEDISLSYGIKSGDVVNSAQIGIAPKDWANVYFSATSTSSYNRTENETYVKSSISPLIPITIYYAPSLIKFGPTRILLQQGI